MPAREPLLLIVTHESIISTNPTQENGGKRWVGRTSLFEGGAPAFKLELDDLKANEPLPNPVKPPNLGTGGTCIPYVSTSTG